SADAAHRRSAARFVRGRTFPDADDGDAADERHGRRVGGCLQGQTARDRCKVLPGLTPHPDVHAGFTPGAYRPSMQKARLLVLLVFTAQVSGAWGARGHQTANRVAVDALPPDGPVFLKEQRDWIAATGPVPDSWRGTSEPYSRLFEDPNHGWFKEQ